MYLSTPATSLWYGRIKGARQRRALTFIPGGVAVAPAAQRGAVEEVKAFNRFLESQPHKHKVVIAGMGAWCDLLPIA
jgi:hypothetical protein